MLYGNGFGYFHPVPVAMPRYGVYKRIGVFIYQYCHIGFMISGYGQIEQALTLTIRGYGFAMFKSFVYKLDKFRLFQKRINRFGTSGNVNGVKENTLCGGNSCIYFMSHIL